MFSQMPTGYRRAIKSTLTASWIISALAGAGGAWLAYDRAAFSTAQSVLGSDTSPALYIWIVICGVLLFTSSIGAAFGVIINRYRWEWSGAWFAALGFFPYLLMHWYNAVTVAPLRLPFSLLLTVVFLAYISRALMCGAHAAKLRAQHETAREVAEYSDIERLDLDDDRIVSDHG